MGIHADDLMYQEIITASIKAEDYSFERYVFTTPQHIVYWQTAGTNGCNGELIKISDMITSHLINSLVMTVCYGNQKKANGVGFGIKTQKCLLYLEDLSKLKKTVHILQKTIVIFMIIARHLLVNFHRF